MIEATYSVLRAGRRTFHELYEPLDCLNRLINGKSKYPPIASRQAVGNLNDFEGSSAEYVAYLRLLCGMNYQSRLLDIGCGCGNLLLDTTGSGPLYTKVAHYLGTDTDASAIEWCQSHLREYNTRFACTKDLRGIEAESFDVIVCKSLFTHLMPSELVDYLAEIKRLLVPGGRCLSTWFLLDGTEPKGKLTFRHKVGDGFYSVERKTKPNLAVAYRADWVYKCLNIANFRQTTYPGTWTGSTKGLSFQDIIVIEKG